jgi:hypothetical protein
MTMTKVNKFAVQTIGFLLQPYASCKKWEKDVESNKDTTKEMKKFEEGASVTTLLGSVSQRLGFSKTLDIGMYILHLQLLSHSRRFP